MCRDGRWMAATVFAVAAWLAGSMAVADVILVEQGGIVVGEAENYSTRTADGNGNNWLAVPIEDAGAGPSKTAGARGFQYIQSLPDNSTGGGPTVPPSIEYPMFIQIPGTYRLYLSWETNKAVGNGGNADSIFVDIVELKDGAGGGFEQNAAGASDNPITWAIATPGLYTLRVSQREDGSAVDAFVFQQSGLPAPTGFGPAPSPIAITPKEDSYVRLGQPTTNFGSAPDVVLKDSGGASSITDFRVQVFGLKDGLAAEVWDEDTIIWNNAPANASNNDFTSDALFLGEFAVTGADVGGSLITFSSQDLLDFVLSDTDDLLTLMLRREAGNSQKNLAFASKENQLLLPVSLVLTPNIPEPATLTLLAFGGLGLLLLRRRRYADSQK